MRARMCRPRSSRIPRAAGVALCCLALFSPVAALTRAASEEDLDALVAAVNASEDDAQVLRLLARIDRAAAEAGRDGLAEQARRLRRAVEIFRDTLLGRPVSGKNRSGMRSILDRFPRNSPLFPTAAFYAGRMHFWRGREGGRRSEYQRAEELFKLRAEAVKPGPILRMYLGERIPWSRPEVVPPECDAPEWARLQYELLNRLLVVIHYWVEDRQQPDGQLGGGWGDDCEILRSWPVAILGADDPVARRGLKRLVDGLWEAEGLEELGFPNRVSDVEHVAEDVSDTQPAMLAYDYGNPKYVERCMKPAGLMRDLWTAVNKRGQRLFRSAWFSATQVREEKPYAVDVFYTARAAKPAIWLAWYGGYPEVKEVLCEWLDTWVDAAKATSRGKPAGVLPPAIGFEDGRIGGYGKSWWDPDLRWSYYVWPGAIRLMHEALLAAYAVSGERRYLEPIETEADLAMRYGGEDGPAGSPQWCAARLRGLLGPALAKRRLLTGDKRYDDYLMRHGTHYMRFLLTGDPAHLVSGLEAALSSMRYNLPMVTSEVRYTDRVWVRGHELLFSMFTGADGIAHYYPVFSVTWLNTHGRVAACVREAGGKGLVVWAYNFDEEPRRVGMRLWRLAAGSTCRWQLASDRDGDGKAEAVLEQGAMKLRERGQALWLTLPPRRLVLISVTSRGAKARLPDKLPDLAIGEGDARVRLLPSGRAVVRCKLHNLGAADARGVRLAVAWLVGDQKPAGERKADVGTMAAVRDLQPSIATVRIILPPLPQPAASISLSCECKGPELTTVNNRIVVAVPAR